MKFLYIKHYGESFGDDINVKMNYFKNVKWLFNVYCLLIRRFDAQSS